MEKIIMLGTGHGGVLDCYNTCFLLQNNQGENILVDTGAGDQIRRQMRDVNVDIRDIHEIIISHQHTDHVWGLFILIQKIAIRIRNNEYTGNLTIYMHKELTEIVSKICKLILVPGEIDWIDKRIFFRIVEDKEEVKILNYNVKFLDVHAKKEKQFGFKTTLENGKTLLFLGDETFDEALKNEAENVDWFLHEAMCRDAEKDIVKPFEKAHCTVKAAAEIAESLKVENLLLYHSGDIDLKNRKKLYTEEAQKYFTGNIYVPYDLEVIEL